MKYNQILLGDCLELLRTLPNECCDSVITDPPYGLGNKDPDAMDIFMYVLGATLDTGGDFMGRDWDIPSVQIWREVYRVLKPGGYVVSFGGTRTFDLISIGLRMAGFECRDTISRFHPEVELPVLQWVQGCLTPDVEVLTPQGWMTYESLSTDGDLLVFDPSNVTFSWAQPSQVISYQHEGPMVHVQTVLGSYDVTPDHTVYHLAGGRWLPARASTLDAAEVPSVQDLSGLLDELHRQRRQAGSEEGVLKGVLPGVDCASTDGSQGPSHLSRQDPPSVPPVQEAFRHASGLAEEVEASSLLPVLQRTFKEQLHLESGVQGAGSVDSPIPERLRCKDDGAKQSIVGGRSDLPPIARELRPCEVREVPSGVHADGSKGRLRVRAPVAGGSASRSTPLENGGRSSRGPRLQEQFSPEPDALPQSERAQAVRGTRFTQADLAGFTTTAYQGLVWCVTVPTGAFVARRNGYVFITGNSGMPKSHSIGKAIDKKLGKKRTKVVGVKPGHEEFAGRGNNSSIVALSESSPHAEGFSRPWMKDPEKVERYHQKLAPESEEAAAWEGWGSALKPSWEPILLFRKPFKGTLADNVLEHGTGGINIDATRVRHASKADFDAHKAQVDAIKEKGGSRDKSWKNSSDLSKANDVKEGGRWPANVLLEHVPYAEWWRLRGDISELQRQEALAYYGVEQALSTMQQSDLGNAGGAGETEILLEDVRGPIPAGGSTAEDRLGDAAVPSVPLPIRGAAGLGPARSKEVLLKEVQGSDQLRQTPQAGQGSSSRIAGTDEQEPAGQASAGEVEPMEGWAVCLRAGVRFRHGRSALRASKEPSSGDAERSEAEEVHRRAPSGGGRKAGARDSNGRGRSPRQRTEGRQPSGEPGSGLEESPQPSPQGNRDQGGSAGSTGCSFDGGEFELEVRSDLIPKHLGTLFTLVTTVGCRPLGAQRVKARPGSHAAVTNKEYRTTDRVYGKYAPKLTTSHIGLDGREEVDAWECVEGCPVRELNDQSGERPSTLTGRADPSSSHRHPGTEMNPNSAFLGERTHLSRVYADGGGAARFFTQFEGDSQEARKGRWPANLVLSHADGCRNMGPRRFRGSGTSKTFHEGYDGDSPTTFVRGVSHPGNQHGDADGLETADAWECVEGCPVRALDEQSGERRGGGNVTGNEPSSQTKTCYGEASERVPFDSYADSGGASRFFSQFDGVPFKYVPKANRKEAGCGEFEVQHITVKPLALMRWLVKLVTRKGGVVLDLYAGSGSTLHAAVLEEMQFIGMERDETNHAEAEKRLAIVLAREEERRDAEELFEFSMGRGEGSL